MTTPAATAVRHLLIKQRFTLGVNRYEIRESDEARTEGTLLAMAQQKRFKLKEEVIFFADEARTQRVFSFKARNVMDLKSVADILDANQQPLGHFRKDFGASLVRSTWFVGQNGGQEYRGEERSMAVAILRRILDIAYVPYHFDFVGADGRLGFSVVKGWGIRDKYLVSIFDASLDYRVVGAMAVALDSLQNR